MLVLLNHLKIYNLSSFATAKRNIIQIMSCEILYHKIEIVHLFNLLKCIRLEYLLSLLQLFILILFLFFVKPGK